ncbi:MAG TPA: hypothetical protein VFU13_10610 [Steroidobacteraceae bacterium]|nr:hypothetical protein [Steroidobacteraceae bacterium]
MMSRRRFSKALVLLGVFGLHAQAGETAVIPECPASPSADGTASRPVPNNVRLVTGQPYSALGTSQTVTTLPDGNRIVRQNTIRLWRDSDGRTRSEFSLSSIGGPRPLELNTTVTVIDDPAARERYMLQPAGKVAVTVPIVPCRVSAGLEPDLSVGPPRPPGLPMQVSTPVKLGERQVDGETAAGSRVEATIPAGAIGNKQPIRMSAEQWYGKDLQVVVEATYRDPRTGETRYKLSDIHRDEPDARLFRVPDNYTRAPAPVPLRRR